MKKRILYLLAVAMLCCTACGSKTVDEKETEAQTSSVAASAESEETVEEETAVSTESVESAPMVEVDEGLFTVEFTISAEFAGETTQEELDATCADKGFKSATLNEDGSVTYVMTKAQHKQVLEEMAKSIDDGLQELVGSESYPNVTKIEHNNDFTSFTITTKNEEPDLAESFSVIAYYMYGGMYAAFAGEEVEDILVEYVNEASGNVIMSANYADYLAAQESGS